jgi:hypothetical protein
MDPGARVSLGTAGYQNPRSGALRAETISGRTCALIDEEGNPKDRVSSNRMGI